MAALVRGDRETAGELIGGLTPMLEVGAGATAPQLNWESRQVGTTPSKLFDSNPSPRRRVVIWNSAPITIRIAESENKLQTGAGGPLVSGGIFIDEFPYPHGGEWWAIASVAVTIDVAQLQ